MCESFRAFVESRVEAGLSAQCVYQDLVSEDEEAVAVRGVTGLFRRTQRRGGRWTPRGVFKKTGKARYEESNVMEQKVPAIVGNSRYTEVGRASPDSEALQIQDVMPFYVCPQGKSTWSRKGMRWLGKFRKFFLQTLSASSVALRVNRLVSAYQSSGLSLKVDAGAGYGGKVLHNVRVGVVRIDAIGDYLVYYRF